MIGQAVFDLGGGRINKDASIDYDAGIPLLKEKYLIYLILKKLTYLVT